MARWSNVVRFWHNLRHRRRVESELDDELQTFVDLLTDEHVAAGVAPAEARRLARVELGGAASVKDHVRAIRAGAWLDSIVRDLRMATRTLRRRPVFAIAAVLSIGLGLAANVAVLDALHSLVFRPLPVERPQELVRLVDQRDTVVYSAYDQLHRGSSTLSAVIMMTTPSSTDIRDDDERARVSLQMVSDDFFDVLGVRPTFGRVLHEPSPGVSREPIAVISHAYWQRRYGGSPAAIGARFFRRDQAFTIGGVAAREFRGANIDVPVDIWVPFEYVVPPNSADRTQGRWIQVLGRLRPGATSADATAEATRVLGRPVQLVAGATGFSALRAELLQPLIMLAVVVGFALLITCANLVNLSLSSASARHREFAVRLALGASRWRLVRQLLTESLLLTALGAAVAVALAFWANGVLLGYLPQRWATALPNLALRFDSVMAACLAALAIVTWLLVGVLPAFKSTAASTAVLKVGAIGGARSHGWIRRGLVVVEVAMCTITLVVAGLFVRTVQNLLQQDTGYQAERLLVADVEMPRGYSETRRDELFEQLVARAAALPGVVSAGFSRSGQLSGSGIEYPVRLPGAANDADDRHVVFEQRVSPDFLDAMGTRLLAGRAITNADTSLSRHVAIVNEQFVRLLFPEGQAVGRSFIKEGGSRKVDDIEIVGVVEDSKWINLREASPPMYYVPYRQMPGSPLVRLAIRTSSDVPTLGTQLVQSARGLDREIILTDVVPFGDVVDRTLVLERLLADISSAVGIVGLMIASIGLHAVLAGSVTQRRREIGVRIAIGALPSTIEWMIVRESLGLLAVGFLVGVPIALAGASLASSMLFGLRTADPMTAGLVLAVLAVATLAASYFPARQAARIDPIVVLRDE